MNLGSSSVLLLHVIYLCSVFCIVYFYFETEINTNKQTDNAKELMKLRAILHVQVRLNLQT